MITPTMAERKILRAPEAAAMLGIAHGTLRRWLFSNYCGIRAYGYKVGGNWLFYKDELDAFIRSHRGDLIGDEERTG